MYNTKTEKDICELNFVSRVRRPPPHLSPPGGSRPAGTCHWSSRPHPAFFSAQVLDVQLNKGRMVAVLESKIHVFDLKNMYILTTVDTPPNPSGICALSPSLQVARVLSRALCVTRITPLRNASQNCYMAFPSNQLKGEVRSRWRCYGCRRGLHVFVCASWGEERRGVGMPNVSVIRAGAHLRCIEPPSAVCYTGSQQSFTPHII